MYSISLRSGAIGLVAGGAIKLVSATANTATSANQTAFYTMIGVLGAALISAVAMVVVARSKTPSVTPPSTPHQDVLMELVKEQAEMIVAQAGEIGELKAHARRKN